MSKGTPPSTSADRAFPIYDAFLDLPFPAASKTVNGRRIIIAPPPGEAFSRSRDVGVELATEEGLARVASFCFPEFHEELHGIHSGSVEEGMQNKSDPRSSFSVGLNRFDTYLKDYYLTGNKRPSSGSTSSSSTYHSFAMQLSNGQRVYGHVRRYLPHHLVANSRIDVGRRGIRAMVILTRASASGGENFYHALLKTIEAITSHRAAVLTELQGHSRPQQHFLHFIHSEHDRLAAGMTQNSKITFQGSTIFMKEIELGSNMFQHVDYCKFLLPQSLLLPRDSTEASQVPILPLLRCVGISHALRILSALMCERRVILVSQTASRLSACASAATSMLAQGLLHWQHIYIPILPPSMMNYLAAPMPYLIGVTANHAGGIDQIPGLGEVLVVYLDGNDLKTHNMSRPDMAIPDILLDNETLNGYGAQGPYEQQRYASVADILKMDLINVMKTDRKFMDISVGSGTAAVAGKGKEMLKKGVGKLLKNVVKKQPKQHQMSKSNHGNGITSIENLDPECDFDETSAKDIYIFGEGFDHELAEEEARISFATFFLTLIGDMKMYLRAPNNSNEPPKFDKELFLHSRQRLGDHKNTPMYPLLVLFKESQIFEQFVLARIAEIQRRKEPANHASLFILGMKFHNSRRIPFSSPEIRQVLSRISQQSPSRHLIRATDNIRKRAMNLTSNSRVEQIVPSELSQLVQDCREGSSFLVEVMSVVWERLKDCRGMKWKHGLYALQLLTELILHGPMGVVTEATDGIDKIRRLKLYENNMRPQVMQEVRKHATFIYKLLVNRAQLFSMRRICALRRIEQNSSRKSAREKRADLRMRMKFNVVHSLLKPGGTATQAATENLLSGVVSNNETPNHDFIPTQPSSYGSDLLSIEFSPPSGQNQVAPSNFTDTNGLHKTMNGLLISQAADPKGPEPSVLLAGSTNVSSPSHGHIMVQQAADGALTSHTNTTGPLTYDNEPTIVQKIPPPQRTNGVNGINTASAISQYKQVSNDHYPQMQHTQQPSQSQMSLKGQKQVFQFDPFL